MLPGERALTLEPNFAMLHFVGVLKLGAMSRALIILWSIKKQSHNHIIVSEEFTNNKQIWGGGLIANIFQPTDLRNSFELHNSILLSIHYL